MLSLGCHPSGAVLRPGDCGVGNKTASKTASGSIGVRSESLLLYDHIEFHIDSHRGLPPRIGLGIVHV